MTRTLRILQSTTNAAAPPPEAVAIESDFVVILAALLCSLICVVGLIAVARCAWLRRGSGAVGELPRRSLANKGIKKKVLQSMPKFTYINSNPSEWVASSECAICLSEFVEGDEIRVLPQCGHGFHVRCIDPWLGSHSSCPSCRALLAVPRCQKCGQYPAVVGGGGNGGAAIITVIETELKSTEGDNANAAANDNSVIIGANVMSHHHSQSVNGFLP